MTETHSATCKRNIQCLVIHLDGICSWKNECNCSGGNSAQYTPTPPTQEKKLSIEIVEADRIEPVYTNDFVECDSCRAKPGSPTLCYGCLNNRDLINRRQSKPAQHTESWEKTWRELPYGKILKKEGWSEASEGFIERLLNQARTQGAEAAVLFIEEKTRDYIFYKDVPWDEVFEEAKKV